MIRNNSQILFRPFLQEETQILLKIWEDAVRATHHFLTEADIIALSPEVLTAFKHTEILIAEQHNRVAGFIGLSRTSETVHVEMLFVAPEAFRRGIGTALFASAKQAGTPLTVDVNEQNPDALAFYQQQGCQIWSRSPYDHQGRPFPLLHLMCTQ